MRRTAQRRGEAPTVKFQRRRHRQLQQVGEGREEVRALDNRVSGGGGLRQAGPDDDARLARAALVGGGFAAAQRRVAGDRHADDFRVRAFRFV